MQLFLIDLDETLYPKRAGVLERVDRRINDYLERRMGVPAAEVDVVRRRLRDAHGTTLRGLMLRHEIDPDDYLGYVHDVDLSDLLRPDPALRRLLGRLPGRKAVLTNASRRHASQVLRLLAVEDAFEAVVAIEDMEYVCKPDPRAFAAALSRLGAQARDCCFVDDVRANVAAARELGMRAVWLRSPREAAPDVHHVIETLHELEAELGFGR